MRDQKSRDGSEHLDRSDVAEKQDLPIRARIWMPLYKVIPDSKPLSLPSLFLAPNFYLITAVIVLHRRLQMKERVRQIIHRCKADGLTGRETVAYAKRQGYDVSGLRIQSTQGRTNLQATPL